MSEFTPAHAKARPYHPLQHPSSDHPEQESIAHALDAIAEALCRLDFRLEQIAASTCQREEKASC